MRSTEKLIEKFSEMRNPLGGSIHWPDEEYRIEDLRKRLDLTQKELDEKPASLKRLEAAMIEYSKTEKQLSTEDLILFMREVTIYVGKVLILSCGGKWDTISRNLRLCAIEVISEEDIEKSNGRFIVPIAFPIGNWVAESWDEIHDGRAPLLYKLYEKARRYHKIREKARNWLKPNRT